MSLKMRNYFTYNPASQLAGVLETPAPRSIMETGSYIIKHVSHVRLHACTGTIQCLREIKGNRT